jgi:hypothetical protein
VIHSSNIDHLERLRNAASPAPWTRSARGANAYISRLNCVPPDVREVPCSSQDLEYVVALVNHADKIIDALRLAHELAEALKFTLQEIHDMGVPAETDRTAGVNLSKAKAVLAKLEEPA